MSSGVMTRAGFGIFAAGLEIHADDVALLLFLGIGDARLEHETVHLRLGERIGTLLLEGVLRSQHEERLRQRIGLVADGHLPLLHGLQQGALHLGGRTVDLVGQDEVGENGALLHVELLLLLRVDERTDDVGRQQVRRELYAAETGIDRLGEGRDGQRLGQTGHALQQDVAVGKQSDEQRVDQVFLADDHLAHLAGKGIDEETLAFDALVQFVDVYYFVHCGM